MKRSLTYCNHPNRDLCGLSVLPSQPAEHQLPSQLEPEYISPRPPRQATGLSYAIAYSRRRCRATGCVLPVSPDCGLNPIWVPSRALGRRQNTASGSRDVDQGNLSPQQPRGLHRAHEREGQLQTQTTALLANSKVAAPSNQAGHVKPGWVN